MLLLIYSDNTQVLIKLLVLINLSYIKKKKNTDAPTIIWNVLKNHLKNTQ